MLSPSGCKLLCLVYPAANHTTTLNTDSATAKPRPTNQAAMLMASK